MHWQHSRVEVIKERGYQLSRERRFGSLSGSHTSRPLVNPESVPHLSSRARALSFYPEPQKTDAMAEGDSHVQDEVLRHSLENPEEFWRHQAEHLHWHKKFSSILQMTEKTLPNGITHDSWEWFPDGEISTCYNCVDRHVLDGHGESVAIYFDSPVTDTKEKYTYRQLLDEVETLAGALREEGVKKGDVVMLYSE